MFSLTTTSSSSESKITKTKFLKNDFWDLWRSQSLHIWKLSDLASSASSMQLSPPVVVVVVVQGKCNGPWGESDCELFLFDDSLPSPVPSSSSFDDEFHKLNPKTTTDCFSRFELDFLICNRYFYKYNRENVKIGC